MFFCRFVNWSGSAKTRHSESEARETAFGNRLFAMRARSVPPNCRIPVSVCRMHLTIPQKPAKNPLQGLFHAKNAKGALGTFQAFQFASMKTNNKKTLTFATAILSLTALTTLAGPPVIVVSPPPPPVVVAPPVAPQVVVQSPVSVAPGVSVTVGVPDAYTWDGSEYVGLIGDQYYYLGPNQVWLPMPADRLGYFHDWEKHHKDWVKQATRNEKYRRDAQGHDHPWHDSRDNDRNSH